jgi:signal transduction histidine kinase
VEHNDRVLKALIVETGTSRYAVVEDVTEFEHVEHMAFVSLWIAFFSGVLLSVVIARATANRTIAPLTSLTERVQRDDLSAHPQLLNAADEIGILARAFDSRRAQLEDVLLRERYFTADVSHELRTPLTVILGAAELLASRLGPSHELHAAAERIHRTASETAIRLSALMQLARAPANHASGPLALRELVRQELERCRPLLQGKPVKLSFQAPEEVWVNAAPDLTAIAVSNLLRNACHFTQSGSVSAELRRDRLVVEDTGPGIPAALRPRLFEAFVRGTDDGTAGSGLGLSIVRRVTEHLGWTIALEDAPSGGARFILLFPTVSGGD